ncbi:MAG: GNAT family N-acetyltransferase [Marinisporobacter sp.]|jgi:ribosomal-protein-alanine N-acetyltransferase|nr:GNAT family N-acetyltransferase [Marinisporobacter sp.]
MQKSYETERLYLNVLDKSYVKSVLNYWVKNKIFLENWIPTKDSSFYNIETQKKNLERDLIKINNLECLILWIFKKTDKDFENPIGLVAFSNIIRGSLCTCTLGYLLDKDEEGKRFMSEALKKGIEIIFSEYKLHRIEANVMPHNRPSLKVLEKLGFINEGLFKKYQKINGEWQDHIHLSLTNEEIE